jgi:Uncharacterized protein conserved in bacteria (DUF2252)
LRASDFLRSAARYAARDLRPDLVAGLALVAVAIPAETDSARIPELLPIRYERMLQSPFTFPRGAAAVMAHDLSALPQTGAQRRLLGLLYKLSGLFQRCTSAACAQ